MKVEFRKTGERRYAIKIFRDNFSDLEINPAPGFDDLMPHDLCHLIVEQVLSIKSAIFGQIAGGGTAGSFRNPPAETAINKNELRRLRKDKQKGKSLVKQNADDLAKSERATYVCWQNWLLHSFDTKLKQRGFEMKETAESVFSQMSADEKSVYTEESLAKVRAKMNELSRRWQNLKTGESMFVDW